jgi:hypothetical protein
MRCPLRQATTSIRFQSTFANFLSTAFDVVFRNELKSADPEPEAKNSDDPINLSVTDDDLQAGPMGHFLKIAIAADASLNPY